MDTINYTIARHPRQSIDWRKHHYGCPFYRERWFPNSMPELGEPMYQVYCMKDTPPESWEEQEKCLSSRARCWRLTEAAQAKKAAGGIDIPLSSVKPNGQRRSPVQS